MLVQNQPQPFIFINILKVMVENKQQEFYKSLLKQEDEILDELKGKEILEQRLKLVKELIRAFCLDEDKVIVATKTVTKAPEQSFKYSISDLPLSKELIKTKPELWYFIVYDSKTKSVTVDEAVEDAIIKFPNTFKDSDAAKTSARNFLSILYNKGDGVLDVDTIRGKGYTYKTKQELLDSL